MLGLGIEWQIIGYIGICFVLVDIGKWEGIYRGAEIEFGMVFNVGMTLGNTPILNLCPTKY